MVAHGNPRGIGDRRWFATAGRNRGTSAYALSFVLSPIARWVHGLQKNSNDCRSVGCEIIPRLARFVRVQGCFPSPGPARAGCRGGACWRARARGWFCRHRRGSSVFYGTKQQAAENSTRPLSPFVTVHPLKRAGSALGIGEKW